jgi:hypothetical protein
VLSDNVAVTEGNWGSSSLHVVEKFWVVLSDVRFADPGRPYWLPLAYALLKLTDPGKWLPLKMAVDASTPVSLSTDVKEPLSWLRL